MTKRIFHSICIAAVIVFLCTAVLFMGVLYEHFSHVQQDQLRMQTSLAAQGMAHEGRAYFDGIDLEDYRVTWIDADGTVLYDSSTDAAKMEDHSWRKEVREALRQGVGESVRYSDTLLERSFYCAQRLEDGTVIRLSVAQNTVFTLLIGMLQPISIIFLITLGLSLFLASRLSRKIVEPLNELDLDHPLSNDGYDELSPLLHRLDLQQHQLKQQSDALLQKQQEFETVTTDMAEGIVLLDSKRAILSINPAAQRLLGIDPSCVGQTILSVDQRPELQELLSRTADGAHGELVLALNGGNYQLDASPIVSNGHISGTVLLLLDVTEKERAEQMRREFTANVSHELKTPLQTISGCAELMTNGMVKEADIGRFSAQIYAEAQRMIGLVEDILDLSHLDEGAADMKREDVDLYALSQETVNSLLPKAEAARVHVSLEGEAAVVHGIPQLLRSIVYDLCDNAIKYDPPDGSVTVSVRSTQDSVRLTVADTGIGIPPEHQDRIFERFYRVDKSHSKEIGGTGLGLSIVKHAAKLHDAAIELQSKPGKGTTITVIFPKDPHKQE